ncbi:PD-(D/E)XK nuclease family protein [Nostoc sp. B(2019)]|nr:PD-(D/E)XK nuclease family protein [Nostoc sp. B(2019)]
MLSTTTQLLRLSQGQLNLLEACPRKFQHTYLEQLSSPLDPEHEERQTLGSRFHLLMQQREMGLPIDSFLQVDTQLQKWMSAFGNAAPEVLTPATNNQTFRESEHYRTLQVQDYLLTVIYDLLIADNQQAQILDWKTYPKPPSKSKLAQNWQTRLYMYVLAETSEYLPEKISMTYWFVQSEGKPQNIKFNYNAVQHGNTAKKLNQLLSKLTNWLKSYQNNEQFPQVMEDSKTCDYCQFATRCERKKATDQEISNDNQLSVNGASLLQNLANIREISL